MKKFLQIKILNKNKGSASSGVDGFTLSLSKGYTIIETMISISIFLIVITVGINFLLNIYFSSQYTNKKREILDNLSFVMEDMVRHIRTGYDYYCTQSSDMPSSSGDTKDCSSGGSAIFFREALSRPSDPIWGYRVIVENGKSRIEKTIDGGDNWIKLTDGNEIQINSSIFPFYVVGTGIDDGKQPFIIIRINGNIQYKNQEIPFSLQTGLSQLNPDINL